ncbi:MAG: transposase [Patescibacteria group bacterium]|nr:transposase [Patescibacteria group bacterium]
MRKEPLVTGESYHVYNRGVDKRDIFNDAQDLERFKESIRQFNQVDGIGSLELHHKQVRGLDSHPPMMSEPLVAIIAFCINPNHFHFVLKQLVDDGVAKFLQRLQGGYTYYFNHGNDRSGSLFQGTFKSKLIDSDDYLRKIFGYTNQNYLVHDIPKNKLHFVFASDKEYEKGVFDLVSADEGREMFELFNGKENLKRHCTEIVAIIREERGKTSLNEADELPQ